MGLILSLLHSLGKFSVIHQNIASQLSVNELITPSGTDVFVFVLTEREAFIIVQFECVFPGSIFDCLPNGILE